jgi:5-methylcytosine-specific restriction protein A
LILALDLYFQHRPSELSQTHEKVVNLSEILNRLPIHTSRPDQERFRNPNSVYMKLCNFLRFDSEYAGLALDRGGKLDGVVWEEFAGNVQLLHDTANAIIEAMGQSVASLSMVIDEDEEEFPEGRVLYRIHRSRERNRLLADSVKRAAAAEGRLYCVVCEFDFSVAYGEVGQGFIELHHTVPISDYTANQRTRMTDLALVCANCHRMLHRRRPWLAIGELQRIREEVRR